MDKTKKKWLSVPVYHRAEHGKYHYRNVKINKLSNQLLLDYLEFPLREFGDIEKKAPFIYQQLKELAVQRGLMPESILTS